MFFHFYSLIYYCKWGLFLLLKSLHACKWHSKIFSQKLTQIWIFFHLQIIVKQPYKRDLVFLIVLTFNNNNSNLQVHFPFPLIYVDLLFFAWTIEGSHFCGPKTMITFYFEILFLKLWTDQTYVTKGFAMISHTNDEYSIIKNKLINMFVLCVNTS